MKLFHQTRVSGAIAFALLAVALAATPALAGKRTDASARCTARSTAAVLQVRCPNATVAELLGALRKATGLRSEYPTELATAPVSVSVKGASLQQVVGAALSAYNIALWKDPSAPSVTWLRIVGQRQAPPGGEGAAVAYQESVMSPEPMSASTVALMPVQDEAEMARVRESFARSVKPAPGLKPVPVESAMPLLR
jgi:hypothetical protein